MNLKLKIVKKIKLNLIFYKKIEFLYSLTKLKSGCHSYES